MVRKPCADSVEQLHASHQLSVHVICWLGGGNLVPIFYEKKRFILFFFFFFFLRIALKKCVFVWGGVLCFDFEVNYSGNYFSQLMP